MAGGLGGLFLGLSLFLFVLRDDFLLDVGGDLLVLVELHGEGAATLGNRAQVGCIVQHLGLGDIGSDLLQASACRSHAQHAPALGVDVTHHVTHVVLGYGDGDGHNWFQDGGAGLWHCFLHTERGGDFKGLRGGVYRVVFAIHQCDLDVDHGVARDEAAPERVAHAFFDARDILPWYYAA